MSIKHSRKSKKNVNRNVKKILLMGRHETGKTSMRSIIFANYIARDTRRLGATIGLDRSHVKFLGNLQLNLWDCGGQEAFMQNYLEQQKDKIFCNVGVLIYVFDVKSKEKNKDFAYFRECIEAIMQNSKDAKVFCLIHKMDLIPKQSDKHKEFKDREKKLIEISQPKEIKCFKTSIWDETLYQCWSDIIYSLVPNIKSIEKSLDNFTKICGADEVVLFEKATFLVVAHSERKEQNDVHRFEKISNIVKQFKLSCSKANTMFNSMNIKNKNFNAYIEKFTDNTYIMVIIGDSTVLKATTLLNIQIAKNHFQKLINKGETEESSSTIL